MQGYDFFDDLCEIICNNDIFLESNSSGFGSGILSRGHINEFFESSRMQALQILWPQLKSKGTRADSSKNSKQIEQVKQSSMLANVYYELKRNN